MVSYPPAFYHMARGGVRFLQAICQLCIFRMLGSLVLSPEWQGWAPSGCYDSSPVFLGQKESSISCLSFPPLPEMATVKNKLFCFPLLFLLLSALFQPEHTWSVHTLQVGQCVFQPLHGLHLVALEASQTKLLWEDRTGNGFTQGRLSGKQHRLVTASLWGYPNKPSIFHI